MGEGWTNQCSLRLMVGCPDQSYPSYSASKDVPGILGLERKERWWARPLLLHHVKRYEVK